MGNSVSKSNVKFTSIGCDHGIEQENKRLKVSGGIVGITQQEQALQRFFLAAPVLSALFKDFELNYTEYRDISSKHHDLYGNKPKRMQNNAQSLCRVVSEHGEPFTSQDTRLYNILTHALVTEKVEEEILMRDELGQRLFEEFVVRLDGNISIWSEMKKRKIGSFKQNNKEVKITTEKGKVKVATLIKDGVAAEKEFLEIETATMAADLTPNTPTPPVKKVVILDGMAIVNALPKDKDLQFEVKTCKDLAELFVLQVVSRCSGYDDVRLIFDRYVSDALKSKTREGRNKGIKSTQYRINDAAVIKNIKLRVVIRH